MDLQVLHAPSEGLVCSPEKCGVPVGEQAGGIPGASSCSTSGTGDAEDDEGDLHHEEVMLLTPPRTPSRQSCVRASSHDGTGAWPGWSAEPPVVPSLQQSLLLEPEVSGDEGSGSSDLRWLWGSPHCLRGSSGRPQPGVVELIVAGGLRDPVSRLRGRLALWTAEACALDGPLTFVEANPCGTRPFSKLEVGGYIVLVRGSSDASCLKQVLNAGAGNAAGILIADDKGDELCCVALPVWAGRLVVPTAFASSADGLALVGRLGREGGRGLRLAAVPAPEAPEAPAAVLLGVPSESLPSTPPATPWVPAALSTARRQPSRPASSLARGQSMLRVGSTRPSTAAAAPAPLALPCSTARVAPFSQYEAQRQAVYGGCALRGGKSAPASSASHAPAAETALGSARHRRHRWHCHGGGRGRPPGCSAAAAPARTPEGCYSLGAKPGSS
mmetsp:Transcript_54740/g.169855  ORF Transcript_54740/g.169855 Transcript_54740/m.169855 type:complete len:443 (-) Transcript_54740:322-1650(-)